MDTSDGFDWVAFNAAKAAFVDGREPMPMWMWLRIYPIWGRAWERRVERLTKAAREEHPKAA